MLAPSGVRVSSNQGIHGFGALVRQCGLSRMLHRQPLEAQTLRSFQPYGSKYYCREDSGFLQYTYIYI